MRLFPRRRSIAFAALALAACHDSPTEPVAGRTLRFSGAAGVADTIGAPIPQALVVEVHDSTGALAPAGTVVRFTAVPGQPFSGPEVLVEPLTATYYTDFATGVTDQSGKTGVLVQLGIKVGPARLVVTVPTLGLQDTVRFTVNPGNAAHARVSPADTVLYVGQSFTLRSGVVDRAGNPRPDPVAWTSSGSGVTVTSAGVVTATALGRYRVKAAGVAGSDSGSVSVVPPGRLVAWSGYYTTGTLTTLDMDGSNQTALASVKDGGIGVHPAWIPGTSTIVYTTVVGNYQTLYTVGTDGVAKPFFATAPPTMTHQAEPTPSADGKWLFFIAYDTRCSAYDYCVERSKIDGSAPELLVATPSRNVAPSPDGTKVAYVAGGAIKVLDIAAQTTSTWSVTGSSLAWSPDGSQIAYVSPGGVVSVVAPDGSGLRSLLPMGFGTISGWSPDGKWLVVQWAGTSTLVDAATGAAVPLGYTTGKLTATGVK
jgi:Tol biopolymer transport system component